MDGYLIFIKLLLLFWFICVVLSSDITKRDVHRIIIKGRRPRSHRHSHRDHYHHHHHHPRHHHHHHGHKYRDSYERDHSYEEVDDSSRYHSHERDRDRDHSYEDDYKQPHRHQKLKPPPYTSSNIEFEEPRVEPFTRDEWTPLLSSENKVLHPEHQPYRNKRNKQKSKRQQANKHLNIDITTSFPQKSHSNFFFETTEYPSLLSPSSSFSFNHKTIDSNRSPLVKDVRALTKLANNTYEVHETPKDDFLDENFNYQALTALHSLALEDLPKAAKLTAQPSTSKEEKEVVKEENKRPERKRPIRGRGRPKN